MEMKRGEQYIAIENIPSKHFEKTWNSDVIMVGTVFAIAHIDYKNKMVKLSDIDRKGEVEHFVKVPFEEIGSRLKPYGIEHNPSRTEADVLNKIRNCKDWKWVGIFEAMIIRQCVQKQVMKKPCYTADSSFGFVVCPICKQRVATKYCPECGQKIDWERTK